MGPRHAEGGGFDVASIDCPPLLLKVNPAGHFITAQFHGTNFDFRGLTAVGSGNCHGREQ